MEARVGTLPVGTQFETTLTGRRGVVRAFIAGKGGVGVFFPFADQDAFESWKRGGPPSLGESKVLHPDVRVRVVEAVH